jgi:hypothetical protein
VEAPRRSNQDRTLPWTSKDRRATTQPAKHNITPNDMNDTGDSLRSFLLELADMDDDGCVLSVRKISKLGFDSAPLLQTYFSKFGTVQRVMVAPTVVKCKSQKTRMRPACLGFVVMKSAAEADAALKLGEAHTLSTNGELIEFSVSSFTSHAI